MGVVFACAFSFMSKYLHQFCGPKPMTRVDINENNQSSNTNITEGFGPHPIGPDTDAIKRITQIVG
jgi:hypothetical protein